MHSEKIISALNNQVNAELYSSYLYLSMSAYFESQNLTGFAKWTRIQSGEEYGHGMKIFDFINQLGGTVILGEIKKPKSEWTSPHEVFENIFLHEQKISNLINELIDLAISEKDHAVNNFLQYFVKEQVEEEASVKIILEKLKGIGDHKNAIYMLDHQAEKRVN
jgi:ferritin